MDQEKTTLTSNKDRQGNSESPTPKLTMMENIFLNILKHQRGKTTKALVGKTNCR
jgi:hypothetical protein